MTRGGHCAAVPTHGSENMTTPIDYRHKPEPPTRSPDAIASLRTLAAWHYVVGGASLLSAIPLRFAVRDSPLPQLFMLTCGVPLLTSAICMSSRRAWLISVIIASCMLCAIPMGTIMGGYTLYILSDHPVRALYQVEKQKSE
jgi:hypothetical protein